MTEQTGKVQTVLGLIEPDQLGKTHTHEHLLVDPTPVWGPPDDPVAREKYYAPMSPEARAWFIHYDYVNKDNYTLSDVDEVSAELKRFKDHGGGSVVEVTSRGLRRNPTGLAEISRRTGVNVVMGSSYYVGESHPADMDQRSEDDIVEEIVRDITEGADGSDIRAGIIGEVGSQWPMTANETKVLRASGRAQRATGAALIIHPGRDEYAPIGVIDILSRVGADVHRTIMSHMDRTVAQRETMKLMAETGCNLEWDLFGREESWYVPNPAFDMANDARRIDDIKWVIEQGFGDQVVVAHDIYSKDRTLRYGGHGYFYILANTVPRMKMRGIGEEAIERILVDNPARILPFAASKED